MTEEEHQRTDSRETEDGPEGSKLAPAGNSKARIFIPSDPTEGDEERSQDQEPEEPASESSSEHEQAEDSPEPSEEGPGRSLPVAGIAAVAGAALAAGLAAASRARTRRPKNPALGLLRR